MRRLRALPTFAFLVFYGWALAELTGCPQTPEPPHVDPIDGGYPPGQVDALDGEDPPVETATVPACAKACKNLKALGCPEAERLDGGSTCYAVCAKAEQSGKFGLHPSCVAAAKTAGEARNCGSIRCMAAK